MERWVSKFLALIGSFILPLFCTLLPYKVSDAISKKGESGKRILSYLMCFGGGIFFGTYLLHMGPEVHTLLDNSLLKPNNIHYPLPDLFVGIGFFVVLFSEKVVLRWNKRRLQRKRLQLPCMLENSTVQELMIGSSKCSRPQGMGMCDDCKGGLPCSGTNELGHTYQNIDESLNIDDGVVKLVMTGVTDIEDLTDRIPVVSGACKYENECPLSGTGECCSDSVNVKPDFTQKEKHIIVTMKVDDKQKKDDYYHHHNDDDESDAHSHHHATRSIILILALSLHRIFEGMSIGLQNSSQNVLHLFVAVMCHETVIGFSLGLQFVKSKFPLRRLLVTSFICSIIMPFGVGVGTVMTETGQTSSTLDVANGLLQAVAMGTFIYVTFFEILQEEVDPEDTSIGKIVFIALGFVMMALLNLIPEEQYSITGTLPVNTSNVSSNETIFDGI